jgi:hypothetical protein
LYSCASGQRRPRPPPIRNPLPTPQARPYPPSKQHAARTAQRSDAPPSPHQVPGLAPLTPFQTTPSTFRSFRPHHLCSQKGGPVHGSTARQGAHSAAKNSLLSFGVGFIVLAPGVQPAGHTSSGFSRTYFTACRGFCDEVSGQGLGKDVKDRQQRQVQGSGALQGCWRHAI